MKRFILAFFLFSLSYSVYPQSDTINQNNITIKRVGARYEYWNSDAKFTGVIKVKLSDIYCYQMVDDGILMKDECAKIENTEALFVWSSVAKDYNPDDAIAFDKLKYKTQQGVYRVFEADSARTFDKILTLNGVEYNGYVKQRDTLYFYYSGKGRFLNTYHKNGDIREYIETKNRRKNGLYVKYDVLGEISEQGSYSMDKKTGEWIEEDSKGLLCIGNYVFGKKTGLNHCYLKDKLLLIQKFNYGELAYYFNLEYRDDLVYHKKYDKDGNFLSTSIYRDNQLVEYIPN